MATAVVPVRTADHPDLAAVATDLTRDGAVATTRGELPTEPFTVTAALTDALAACSWSAQKRESEIHSVFAGETRSDWTTALGSSWSTETVIHVPLTVGRVALHSSAICWVAAWTSGAAMTLSGTPFWQPAELEATAAGVRELPPVRRTTTMADAAAISTVEATTNAMRRPLGGDERARR
jgi:hypothetical protein